MADAHGGIKGLQTILGILRAIDLHRWQAGSQGLTRFPVGHLCDTCLKPGLQFRKMGIIGPRLIFPLAPVPDPPLLIPLRKKPACGFGCRRLD